MSILTSIGDWFAKVFKSVKEDGDKIAIAITEDLQTAIKSGVAQDIANVISAVFPSVKNLPSEIIAELQKILPNILAAELALQGLPDNPTPTDLQNFANAILKAVNLDNDNSELWTSTAAKVLQILENYLALPNKTFAELVSAVEDAFQLAKQAIAGDATT
jgi:hypothetical protein